jgi:phosphatidylglycerophosphate synthase
MTSTTSPAERPGAMRPFGTMRSLGFAGLVLILLAVAIAAETDLGAVFVLTAGAVQTVVASVVVARIAAFHPAETFGLPNGVTLGRAVATALVCGYAAECAVSFAPADALAWGFALLAIASIAVDGVDGWLARRVGPATDFGARFDMEVDALLILALSLVAVALGKAGPWALLIGLMRYLFVAAAWVRPHLSAPLPPSFRRKLVCVIQGLALCLLVLPPVGPELGVPIAAVALVALAWSFAVDVAWLERHRPGRSG